MTESYLLTVHSGYLSQIFFTELEKTVTIALYTNKLC